MTPDGRDNLDILLNSTLLSFAAVVRTDCDRSVVIATLETLEDLLKALRKDGPFQLQERGLTSLLVSVQDLLNNKVSGCVCLCMSLPRQQSTADIFQPLYRNVLSFSFC